MIRGVVAGAIIAISVWVLTAARDGVDITPRHVGQTPVTEYALPGADGPVVIVAHGFAGSQQMMQGYALPLARAGYRVLAFEFLGHGRHPLPMSGDVTAIDGTTRLLMQQVIAVLDSVGATDQPVAFLGHSMATDILVRAAATRRDVGPLVLISAFSQAIDAQSPETLLLVTGAWEPGLRAFALDAAQMVDPEAVEGQTVRDGTTMRRAVTAPFSEHVSVLHSRTGRAEALAWLDWYYGRTSEVRILPTGWALLSLFVGLVLIFRPLVRLLKGQTPAFERLNWWQVLCVTLAPAVVAPVVATWLHPSFLPVLVADHLMVHLLVFGAIQLAMLAHWQHRPKGFSLGVFVLLILWCAVFGFALDRYAANFWPTVERLWIIAVLLLGAVPYMLADVMFCAQAPVWQRLAFRTGFLGSLLLAVLLDFEGLFFLFMIAPVMVLFYLIFGTIGRQAARIAGPVSPGLALGLVLAWALGVSFPLFQV